jgi:site-specific recombinase XerD
MHDTAALQLANLMAYLEGAYAPNTLRAYRADMLEFIAYCLKNNQSALPAQPTRLATFLLQTMSQGIKTATIRRKASSISAIHRLSGLKDPTKHPEVRIAMRKVSRQLGTRFDQAYPVNRLLLERLLTACGQNLRGLRDRALLLLAYDSMRRRSELVSLRIEDIEWHSDEGASVLLRRIQDRPEWNRAVDSSLDPHHSSDRGLVECGEAGRRVYSARRACERRDVAQPLRDPRVTNLKVACEASPH